MELEEAKAVIEQAKRENQEKALEEIKTILAKYEVQLKVLNRLEGSQIINEIIID